MAAYWERSRKGNVWAYCRGLTAVCMPSQYHPGQWAWALFGEGGVKRAGWRRALTLDGAKEAAEANAELIAGDDWRAAQAAPIARPVIEEEPPPPNPPSVDPAAERREAIAREAEEWRARTPAW